MARRNPAAQKRACRRDRIPDPVGVCSDWVSGWERRWQTAHMTWDPDLYHRYSDQRALPYRHLVAAIDGLEPNEIVDLGCGTGSLTATVYEDVRCGGQGVGKSNAGVITTAGCRDRRCRRR
jgi:SAM-dependent methyltransferase